MVLTWSNSGVAYLEPTQTSTMELFAAYDFYPLIVFTKKSIADILLGSRYASACTLLSSNTDL